MLCIEGYFGAGTPFSKVARLNKDCSHCLVLSGLVTGVKHAHLINLPPGLLLQVNPPDFGAYCVRELGAWLRKKTGFAGESSMMTWNIYQRNLNLSELSVIAVN